MYALYGHPRYFKFRRKYQQYGRCFQTIFPFIMAMLTLRCHVANGILLLIKCNTESVKFWNCLNWRSPYISLFNESFVEKKFFLKWVLKTATTSLWKPDMTVSKSWLFWKQLGLLVRKRSMQEWFSGFLKQVGNLRKFSKLYKSIKSFMKISSE